jgi:16S rRNA G966 N2-methylase RsmD
VIADPPYGPMNVEALLATTTASRVIIENDHHVEAPAGWEVTKTKRYGTTLVTMLEPAEVLP